jgi:hypothetical protein
MVAHICRLFYAGFKITNGPLAAWASAGSWVVNNMGILRCLAWANKNSRIVCLSSKSSLGNGSCT